MLKFIIYSRIILENNGMYVRITLKLKRKTVVLSWFNHKKAQLVALSREWLRYIFAQKVLKLTQTIEKTNAVYFLKFLPPWNRHLFISGNKRPTRCNRLVFIAKLIVWSTCFGHHYPHVFSVAHQYTCILCTFKNKFYL